uniref:Uncharacterized protein n=1 Tax=Romanomermis culicivorax TaxID=13658 RepID=A0A915IUI4_ROMCU
MASKAAYPRALEGFSSLNSNPKIVVDVLLRIATCKKRQRKRQRVNGNDNDQENVKLTDNSVQEVRAEANSESSRSHSLCKSDEENKDIDDVVTRICENADF